MAIGLIATLTVQEGKNEEFEQVFRELTEQVLANEPGVTFYAAHRSRSDSQVYKVLEQYRSQEDLDAHGKSEHFRAAGKKLGDLLAAPPEMEMIDSV